MLIPLAGLCAKDRESSDFVCDIECESLSAPDGVFPILSREPARLHVVNLGGRKLSLSGRFRFSLSIPCSRCLEPVEVPFDLPFEIEVDCNLSEEDRRQNLDEQPFLVDECLDVDRLLGNELLLNLPMKVLCKEDCKGICKQCGANLNKVTCSCDRGSPDLRMSAIQDIFNEFKEV